MSSGHYSPLSLAYLIEISFILNIAYHELKSHKLSSEIKRRVQRYLRLANEAKELKFTLGVDKEHDVSEYLKSKDTLIKFEKGIGDGWSGDRRKNNVSETLPEERRQTDNCNWGGRRNFVLCAAVCAYYKLLQNSWDKKIVECCLGALVVILAVMTLCEATNFHTAFPGDKTFIEWETIWFALFVTVILTMMVAVSAMYLGRQLRRFVLV